MRSRINGRLAGTALSASFDGVSLVRIETVLTGWLEDPSALFGVLAQIEGVGFQMLGVRQVQASPRSPESGDER